MSKVVLDVSMSLDGFIAGPNDFGLAMWRLAIHAMTRKLID